jgi:AcrR family transcriptional regulator
VATRIFFERGYADATVQDIADELGILKGSLYHYIDSKEDLLFRLLDQVQLEAAAIVEDVAARADLDTLARLSLYVRASVEFDLSNPRRIAVYYREGEQLSGERLKLIVQRRRTREAFVVGLIREAQAKGDANAALDPTILSNCIFGTIIWMYRWYRPDGGVSAQALGEMCAQFVLGGLMGGTAK